MTTTVSTDFSKRNAGIDLLRALTMFVMIFVNDFWKVHGVPHWLEHAAGREDFMGLADVVFPCFLFAVGMSIPYAIERRYARGLSGESTVGHILGRTLALLVMGAFISNSEARLSPEAPDSIGVYWILMVAGFVMLWNLYPRTESVGRRRLYGGLKVLGVLILGYLAVTFRSPDGGVFAARWGILGSIGWSYVVCALVYVFTRDRLRALVPVLASFVAVCILGSRMNEAWGGAAILDFPRPNFYNDFLGGVLHIGNGATVSFVAAGAVFSIVAARCGRMEFRRKAMWVAVAVASLALLGWVARRFWILSKIQATPTWVFYVCGIAVAAYALLSWMAERGAAGWMNVIKPAGTATLTCYLVPYLAYALSDITGVVLPDWFTHGFMGIVNCLCFALVIIGATWCLGKLKIKLKI
jgi:hypothetical protein